MFYLGFRRSPLFAPPGQFCLGHFQIQGFPGNVNGNGVTLLHQGDGAPGGCFRRDVADGRAPGAAAEAAVREQSHIFVQAHTGNCRGGESISRIPGPPLGPSYRMTMISLGLIFPPIIALEASSSELKTRARPSRTSILGSTADCFTTAPWGAKLPFKMAMPPWT